MNSRFQPPPAAAPHSNVLINSKKESDSSKDFKDDRACQAERGYKESSAGENDFSFNLLMY